MILSRCVPKPWEFSTGIMAVLFFSKEKISVFGL